VPHAENTADGCIMRLPQPWNAVPRFAEVTRKSSDASGTWNSEGAERCNQACAAARKMKDRTSHHID
jgi:hypothetical protein